MATPAPLVFNDVTPDQYARMVEKARAAGIDLNGNSGTASKLGVEVAWNYSPTTGELTLQCLKAPFFTSRAEVEARMEKLVRESLG